MIPYINKDERGNEEGLPKAKIILNPLNGITLIQRFI